MPVTTDTFILMTAFKEVVREVEALRQIIVELRDRPSANNIVVMMQNNTSESSSDDDSVASAPATVSYDREI